MYKIKVMNDACQGPFNCGKCFKVCPSLVFFTYPKVREPNKLCEDWIVKGIFWDQCIGCMQCVEACPTNAIKIKEVA